jgi:AcrR family transcriptional regulator
MSLVEQQPVRRPRGRPRAFDRETALRRAMEVFWEKGFDNCSMSDLVETMEINSPSLYAAFGSKEELFCEAIQLYANAEGGATLNALHEYRDGRAAIDAMLRSNVEVFTQATVPRGCMLILGAVNVGSEHRELHAFLRKRRQQVAHRVRERLAQSVADGELAASVDVDALAALCITVLSGISIQARDGVPKRVLFSVIDTFMATLPFSRAKAKSGGRARK